MADYAHEAVATTTGSIYLSTISEHNLYCHYVADLVGKGLSRIFSASKKEVLAWLPTPTLGLLQKTNIIRDFREGVDQQRYFSPREIWGKEEYGFNKMEDLYEPAALE